MKLSFIIPAYNEAKLIAACLQHIDSAVTYCTDKQLADFEVERIVVDNNSTDDTAAISECAGATVVFEAVNQISRARNAGAAAATGDWLIFVDADSWLPAGLLAEVLLKIQQDKHIGFGSLMEMPNIPWQWRWSIKSWSWLSANLNWAAGSFLVCRRDIFHELGGFSEELFVAEEIEFSRKAKCYARQHDGQFEVLRDHPLITSGRKARLYSQRELFTQLFRLVFRPRKAVKNKHELDVWYDGRR